MSSGSSHSSDEDIVELGEDRGEQLGADTLLVPDSEKLSLELYLNCCPSVKVSESPCDSLITFG